MAFSTQNGGGRGRRGGMSSMAEINIVPLVDVVLVLLVIFMLTAHVMEFGLEVDVPKVRKVADSAKEMPVISVTRDGELYLNEKPVNIHSLGAQFRAEVPEREIGVCAGGQDSDLGRCGALDFNAWRREDSTAAGHATGRRAA